MRRARTSAEFFLERANDGDVEGLVALSNPCRSATGARIECRNCHGARDWGSENP